MNFMGVQNFKTINDVDYALGEDKIDINSNTLHALAPRMTPGKIKSNIVVRHIPCLCPSWFSKL